MVEERLRSAAGEALVHPHKGGDAGGLAYYLSDSSLLRYEQLQRITASAFCYGRKSQFVRVWHASPAMSLFVFAQHHLK